MERIDVYATQTYEGYHIGTGRVFPFGATLLSNGINFSIYSKNATGCSLVLFHRGEEKPFVEIPFSRSFRIGDVYSMVVFNLDFEELEYSYRFDGPWEPQDGQRFDFSKLLLDPYAKAIVKYDFDSNNPVYRGKVIADDFDWQGDVPLEHPLEDTILYECHVQGFTKSDTSKVKYSGTYAGFTEKIPYLQNLGITAVELLPIFEFDENKNTYFNPLTGKPLKNYWGYSTIGYFAPKASYAALEKQALQADEFKNMVRLLHKANIEVILDVVFNHTAEGDETGPCISFRGIDNRIYYMLTPDGSYYNFSGCGNTMNCNHPVVRQMILDCMRYWASEYHIDGFRFDLASILGRNQDGSPMSSPPLLESLAYDCVLSHCKFFAEAWDAGGLYQIGSFPSWGHFSEWNGKYRDTMRCFLKSDEHTTMEAVTRILGSEDLYFDRSLKSSSSVNFFTCHDGFTLMDLVSYNQKHNKENGENNQDGTNDNRSWNCGEEGHSQDDSIVSLRFQQIRNAFALLLLSRGIPMFCAGDEFGRTQNGNNNAYCQDNETTWINWNLCETNKELLAFVKNMIAFRQYHPQLHNASFPSDKDFSIHGTKPWIVEDFARTVAIFFTGTSEDIYFAINTHWEDHDFELPNFFDERKWYLVMDTSLKLTTNFCKKNQEILLKNQDKIPVSARSIVLLIRK